MSVYKEKCDLPMCGSYRAISLLEQVMKVLEQPMKVLREDKMSNVNCCYS